MKNRLVKVLLIVFSVFVVIYPLWQRARYLNWSLGSSLVFNLFPLFGLAAFTLLWLHIVGASIEPWLRKYIDFEKFVENTSNLILFLMLMHPLLLLVGMNFSIKDILGAYESFYILLGATGLALLLSYDIGRMLKRRDFFTRHWDEILFISTVGFVLIFFHSLAIGSDFHSETLRTIWIFYGTTAILSTIYLYIIKRFLN
jgi:hypothetical protein